MLNPNKDVNQERDSQNRDIPSRGEMKGIYKITAVQPVQKANGSDWSRPEGPRRDISREKKPSKPKQNKTT